MSKKLIKLLMVLTAISLALATTERLNAEAIIWTDKDDYSPGEIVTIYGQNFNANAQVAIYVTRPNLIVDDWTVYTDISGAFVTTYPNDPSIYLMQGTYYVLASDGENTSTTSFTDAPKVGAVTVSPTSQTVNQGDTAVYMVYVHRGTGGGSSGNLQVQMYVINANPSIPGSAINFNPNPVDMTAAENLDSTVLKITTTALSGTYTFNVRGEKNDQSSDYAISSQVTLTVQVQTYEITFTESGLPAGTEWTVTWNGTPYSSTSNTITITNVPSGTYNWSVSTPISGGTGVQYVGAPASGSMDVPSQTSQAITYTTQYYLTVNSAYGTPSGEGWYDENTTAYASVADSIVGTTGTRRVFAYWSGDASGTKTTSNAITMDGPKTANANWTTQHYLTVNSAYSTPSGEGWYDENTDAYASVADSIVGTTGTRRVFAYWSGDASGTKTTSNAITMDGPKTANANWTTQHYLTVNSAYSTPSGEGWYDENTTAYASIADSIVYDPPGTRYVFATWGGDATGTKTTSNPILMNGPKTATAYWVYQYYLTVNSPYSTPSGEGWYDENTTAYASVADSIVGTTGTRRVFAYWSGDASGTKTTSNAITMDGPKTANANWTTQHYLTVNSAYSTPSGEGWYDENTDAYASVADSIVDGTPGTRYVFAGWSGDASGTNLTSDPITMDEPKTANADWTTQHYLTVISEYGTTAGEDWYDENTDAYAEVSPLSVPGNADTTFVFAGWTGDATGSTSPSDPIYMDGPKTAIATWDTTTATQVYLTLVTNPLDLTTLTGEGWYDLDSFAPISAPAYVDSSLYRWFFAGWTTDDMTEISDPYSTSTTVLMDMSKTVTANYQKMTRGTNGKSIGFWSAKNGGQPILTLDDAKYVYFLEPYIYGPKYPKERNNARPFDTLNLNTFKRQVNNFLLDANAVDMRYMLAAQLLATILNVRHGYLDVLQEVWVDDGDMVYEPNENWTIGAIIDSALARWSLGSGLSGSPYRATQEHIKNVLDKLNNNQLWYLVTTISTMTVTPQPQTNFSAMSNNSLTTLMPSITVAPNPFTRVATIRYTISISGNVSLNLYDATGRLVRILNDGYLNAGTYTTNLTGMNLAKGIYFLRFKTENYQNKIKVVIQ